jgi:D-psicose/D-tagatose/L-ribulose 3-epimerase
MERDIKFCVNTWIFGNTPLSAAITRAATLGFDGIELFVNEPEDYKPDEVNRLVKAAGIEVFTICTDFSPSNRILCHPNADVRKSALGYLMGCVNLADSVGARSVLVVPSQVGAVTPITSRSEDLQRAIQPLREAAVYAGNRHILLTIEPINRFEVGLVHTLAEAVELAELVQHDACRAMGDTFHMLMEENDGIPKAIRRIGQHWLQHLHVSDNTREAPGMGTMPWLEILQALHEIDFEGSISMEPLPRGFSPTDKGFPIDRHVAELRLGLSYLREEQKVVRAEA